MNQKAKNGLGPYIFSSPHLSPPRRGRSSLNGKREKIVISLPEEKVRGKFLTFSSSAKQGKL